MRTYEELLAAQTELAHFNPNHDPRNGQFSKSSGSSAPLTKSEMKKVKQFEKAMASGNRAAAMYLGSARMLDYVSKSGDLARHNYKKLAANYYDLAEEHRSKMDKYLKKLNKQGVETHVSNKADLDRMASELGKAIKKRGLGYVVDTKAIEQIISHVNVPIKDLPINYVSSGQDFINKALHDPAMLSSTIGSNLASTGGMRPYR